MFYQCTDNFAADCDAYDRWCAESIPLCEDCGADPENTSVAALFRVHGVDLCVDCLKSRYSEALGMEMALQRPLEFTRWRYSDSDLDDDLAHDVWEAILQPRLMTALRARDYKNYDLYLLECWAVDDLEDWCEWLNQNT